MMKKIALSIIISAVVVLVMHTNVQGYGGCHSGYTHTGGGGTYHAGTTSGGYSHAGYTHAGPNGVYHAGTTSGAYGQTYNHAGHTSEGAYGGVYHAGATTSGYGGAYRGGYSAYRGGYGAAAVYGAAASGSNTTVVVPPTYPPGYVYAPSYYNNGLQMNPQ